MKKNILSFMLVVSIACYGQQNQDSSNVDGSPIYWMFKFTTNKLLNTPTGFEQKDASIGAGMDILYDWRIGSKGFGLSPGIGYEMNSYNINATLSTNANEITEVSIISDTVDYKNNALSTHYINIPVEFRYITAPNKSNVTFGFGAGIKVSYLIHSTQKFTVEKGDISMITLEKKLPNLSNFRYNLIGRISYRKLKKSSGISLSVIIDYGFSPLFKNNKGPNLTTYSSGMGVAFIFK